MSNKVKDANLQEKEVQVVKGTIFADEFRDRLTGKQVGGDFPSDKFSNEEVAKLKTIAPYNEELLGLIRGKIKYGTYIYDGENNFVWVEDVPEDYGGLAYEFYEDMLSLSFYQEGERVGYCGYDHRGPEKIQPSALVGLTHSFNELDPALKAIVDAAIADAGVSGVACTQEQWDAIKNLLNNSLYLNYEGVSMIKGITDGIDIYVFGLGSSFSGYYLSFTYDSDANLLYAKYDEV